MIDDAANKKLFLQFCHDIAGPINTINNVSELELNTGGADHAQIQKLLQVSGLRAAVLLQIYRDILFSAVQNIEYSDFIDLMHEYANLYEINVSFARKRADLAEFSNIIAIITALLLMKLSKLGRCNQFKLLIEIDSSTCTIAREGEVDLGKIVDELAEYFATLTGVEIISNNCSCIINATE